MEWGKEEMQLKKDQQRNVKAELIFLGIEISSQSLRQRL